MRKQNCLKINPCVDLYYAMSSAYNDICRIQIQHGIKSSSSRLLIPMLVNEMIEARNRR